MSRLEIFGRPYVVFDPADKRHRSYYHDFVRTSSWGSCPVRFVVADDQGDLLTMIQRSLIAYYVNREFKSVAQKPQALVRQKKKKAVDN